MSEHDWFPERDSDGHYTERTYYEAIVYALHTSDDGPMDKVAGLTEWARFKSALTRWIAEQDEEYDEMARNKEHGIDP